MKYTSALLSFMLFFSVAQYAQIVDGIVAVVDDYFILQSDIEIQQQQLAMNMEVSDDLSCDILDQLILDKLFLVQAAKDSILVSDEEVDNELTRRIQYFVSLFGSEEKLEEYYEKTIFELKEDFRDDIYQQILSDRMRSQIFADVHVSPQEVLDFFNEIPSDSLPLFNAEVEIGQIVILAQPDALQKEEAKKKAEKIRKDLKEGADFEFQALLYSDDPGSASKGGDLGFIKRGELVTPFEAAAFRLKEGEISDVVETSFGYHVIQLLEKQGERIHVRHILVAPDIEERNIVEAKNTIEDIRLQLENDEISFERAVQKHSEDDLSKNNGGLVTNPETGNTFFEMNQLPGSDALAIERMKPGDFSTVMPYQSYDNKTGFRIIYLQSETPAHKANLEDDYNKIKAITKQSKQNTLLIEWLDEKSQSVYIRVDEPYNQCDNISTWLN